MSKPCLGPDQNPRAPKFALPPKTCDCHAHVLGPPEKYPYVAERSYTPPTALLADYQALHRALGIERAVIVQPSVHGTDNRATLDGIAGYGANARGVAVVDTDVTDRELQRLHDGGIRGVRLNLLFGGGVGLHTLEPLAQRVANIGWHIQLLLDARNLVELAPRLRKLPVPAVVDHMGHMNVAHGIDHPGFQTLIDLVRDGVCWVKLSGNYRISSESSPYGDVIPFARTLIDAAPQHMLWGTDWPHPALYDSMPNDGDLLNALDDYAPEAALKKSILVDNPAVLYGFADHG
ncbi:MAG: amidohydrolase family protein [Burkholderiales bacterium]|nr:amidohydrolase family protein [Burkholderiales bacterium]